MDNEIIRRADLLIKGEMSFRELSKLVGVTPQALCSNFQRLKQIDTGRYEQVREVIEMHTCGNPKHAGKIGGIVRWCDDLFDERRCKEKECYAYNTCRKRVLTQEIGV